MKMLGKLVFCMATAATVAPAFAFDPPPGPPPGHRDDRNWHDDRHDDRYDHDRRDDHDRDHRGPPPRVAHHWERGHRYDGRVIVVRDYRDYRLREPPRGYHWVRDDNSGDYLLIAIATGIIADIVTR
jgi:Ni/Co efflux regulator RcnB